MVSLDSDSKSREFLRVVEESGGSADTSTIRSRAGLSKSEVQYRYGKLENMGLIDVERDAELTSEGEPPMKIAVLTETAREEIDKGLLVEAKQEAAQAPDLDELAEQVAEMEEQLAQLEELASWEGAGGGGVSPERVESVEEDVERIRAALNERVLNGLRMLHESVGRIELALEANGIEVSEVEVTEEKHIELNERLETFDQGQE